VQILLLGLALYKRLIKIQLLISRARANISTSRYTSLSSFRSTEVVAQPQPRQKTLFLWKNVCV